MPVDVVELFLDYFIMSYICHIYFMSIRYFQIKQTNTNFIYISYISDFVKHNKQLNWKLECVKHFGIKDTIQLVQNYLDYTFHTLELFSR